MGIFDFIKKKEPANEAEKSKALSLNKRSAPKRKFDTSQNINNTPSPQPTREKSQSVVTAPIHPIKQNKVEEVEEQAAPELHLSKQGPQETVDLGHLPKVNKISFDDLEREKLNLKSQRLSKTNNQEVSIQVSELDKTQVDNHNPINLSEATPLKAPMLGEAPTQERKELKITAPSEYTDTPEAPEKELKITAPSESIDNPEPQKKELKITAPSESVPKESAYSSNTQSGQEIKVLSDSISVPLSKFTEGNEALVQQSELLKLNTINVAVDKVKVIQLLGTGAFKLSIKELTELSGENPFLESTDHSTELELNLTELMPLVPPEWFNISTEQDSKAIDSLSDIENPFNFEGEETAPEKPETTKKKTASNNLLAADLSEEASESTDDTPVLNIEDGEEELAALNIEEDEEEAPTLAIEEDDEEEAPTLAIEEDDEEESISALNIQEEKAPLSKTSTNLFGESTEDKVLAPKEASSLFDDQSPKKKSQSLFATEESLIPQEKKDSLQVKTLSQEKEDLANEESVIPTPEENTTSAPSSGISIDIDLEVFLASFEAAGFPAFKGAYVSNKITLSKELVSPLLMTGRVAFPISQVLNMIHPPMSLDIADQSQDLDLPLAELLAHIPADWMTMEGQEEGHLSAINDIDDPFSSDGDGNFAAQAETDVKPISKKATTQTSLSLLSGDLSETEESRPCSPSKDDLIRDELNRNLSDDTIDLQFAEAEDSPSSDGLTLEIEEEAPKSTNSSPLFAETPVSLQSEKAPAIPAKANELSETIDNSLFAEPTDKVKNEKTANSGLIIEEEKQVVEQTSAEPESPKSLTASGLIIEESEKVDKANETPRKERTSSFLKSSELQRPSSAPNGVDLNRCDLDEILDISYDIEESVTKAILDLREQKGGFNELREILELDQVSSHDFKLLTGMSPSDDLVESERKLNRLLKLDRRKDYSLAQIVDTAQEELDFKSIVLSSKDGLQICAAGDSELFDTNSELLASISPQLFKKTKQFIEQSMLPQPDLFTFYTKDNPVTFAPAGEIAIVFIHDSPWPTPGQMAKARNLVAELGWFCSRRLVL